jgi:hypothetical protein
MKELYMVGQKKHKIFSFMLIFSMMSLPALGQSITGGHNSTHVNATEPPPPVPTLPVIPTPQVYAGNNNYLMLFASNVTGFSYLVQIRQDLNGSNFLSAFLGIMESLNEPWLLPDLTKISYVDPGSTDYNLLGKDQVDASVRYIGSSTNSTNDSTIASSFQQAVSLVPLAAIPQEEHNTASWIAISTLSPAGIILISTLAIYAIRAGIVKCSQGSQA